LRRYGTGFVCKNSRIHVACPVGDEAATGIVQFCGCLQGEDSRSGVLDLSIRIEDGIGIQG